MKSCFFVYLNKKQYNTTWKRASEKRDPLYNKGMTIGIEQGIQKGKQNGKLESAYIIVTKYQMPVAKIAQDFGLEESELLSYIVKRREQE